MSSEIVTREAPSAALVTREYLEAKRELVRSLYAPKTSDLEFEHFLETCATRGLNPLAKQIYAVTRYSKKENRHVMSIQTGIDGFRLLAQRTGQYRGQVGPEWCGADGVWREVWLADEQPAAARVGVLRAGFAEPVYAVARWGSYAQEGSFWQRMGDVMLAKCAESLALRKAFPEELSGLYTAEEVPQAEPVRSTAKPEPKAHIVVARWAALREEGLSDDAMVTALQSASPRIVSSQELADDATYERARQIIRDAATAARDDTDDMPVDRTADADAAERAGDEAFGSGKRDPDDDPAPEPAEPPPGQQSMGGAS